MEENLYRLQAKKDCGTVGRVLLIFYKILTDCVSLALVMQAVILTFQGVIEAAINGVEFDPYSLMQSLMDAVSSNFWGYIVAVGIGLALLFTWKGKAYWSEQICAKEKKMDVGSFFCLLVFVMSAQLFVQLFAPVLEWLLNKIGLSAMSALEMATIDSSSVSAFLYIAFLGPFAEEILFRGLILRTLRPYGKGMAIVVSALLFGLYHGNIIQIPYAFLVGLVLAYTALEYSIFWAIVLHVFNNFVLADLMDRVGKLLPEGVIDIVFIVIISIAALAALIIGICRRKEIGAYARENKVDKTAMRGVISSPAIWIFTGLMLISAVFLLFM